MRFATRIARAVCATTRDSIHSALARAGFYRRRNL